MKTPRPLSLAGCLRRHLKNSASKLPSATGVQHDIDDKFGAFPAEKQSILCRQCRQRVTGPEMAIAVNGRHLHHFKNPAGIAFWIRCFSRATGLIILGMPEKEHTWFPGYGWSVAVCASCALHLGWFYRSDDDSFFGLIRDNLIEDFTTH